MNTYEARIKPLAYWFGRQTIRLPHWLTIVVTVAFAIGLVYQAKKIVVSATSREAANKSEVQRARMSDEISVRAAGRGNPRINLSDGHELVTPYSGPPELTQVLENNQARPLSLCSADFDEDGVPDLISGYAGPSGGIVTILRGNVDSIYPNAPEAKQRKEDGAFTDAPFLSPAFVFGVPEAADFIGAGDFDGDGHWDVVAGARGSNKLCLMSGDGKGGLRQTKAIDLPGGVTAMEVGEINRRDGLDDVIVGINGEAGAQALVFEGPEGALRGQPEAFPLKAEAAGFALGQLDDEYEYDLAVAAGDELLIVAGRDRKLALDTKHRAEVKLAAVARFSLPFVALGIAIGDFADDKQHQRALALLATDGRVHLVARGTLSGAHASVPLRAIAGRSRDSWRVSAWDGDGRLSAASSHQTGNTKLLTVRASSLPLDGVAVLDGGHQAIRLLTEIVTGVQAARVETSPNLMSLGVEGGAVAVLPMRLNSDALSDLVVFRNGGRNITTITTRAQNTFVVTNANDSGLGSLQDAIEQANNSAGADTITFSIGTGAQTITPFMPLPQILEAAVIDATTQPGYAGKPLIELNGSNLGPGVIGIGIRSGNTVLRGVAINRFTGEGMHIAAGGKNRIEGNFIGVNLAGTTAQRNGANGILIFQGSSENVIGGTTSAARNVISGNDVVGILAIDGVNNNLIQGNFIGTDFSGGIAIGNSGGVTLSEAPSNVVGGIIAGAGNLISGNRGQGVSVFTASSQGNMVQGNRIGTDVSANTPLGNTADGVVVFDAPRNTIGGTTQGARNILSGNGKSGVAVAYKDSVDNLIQGNYIGANVDGLKALGNNIMGVAVNFGAVNTLIGGATGGASNLISGNADSGIYIQGVDKSENRTNQVQGNYIGTDVTGTKSLSNRRGIYIANSSKTLIGGTTAGARNLISGNQVAGVAIYGGESDIPGPKESTDNKIQGNFIGVNNPGVLRLANGGDGIQITITNGSAENTIGGDEAATRNIISGNEANGIAIGVRFSGVIGSDGNPTSTPGTGGKGITVQNNFIGTDVTGTACIGNTQNGIFVDADSVSNFIRNNLIACNGQNGVFIPANNNPGVRIAIESNSIVSNAALGIDLGQTGVTANDDKDPDNGANELQNFPILTSSTPAIVSRQASRTIGALASASVTGRFNSTPNTTFTLQFFFGSNCQGTGHQFTGLIPVPLNPTIQVLTDTNGNAGFTYTFQVPIGFGPTGFVNCSATNSTGNTSELSECIAVANPGQLGPIITDACKGEGKQLVINGSGFVDGAKVFINGEREKKTQFVSSTQVIALKAGKRTFTDDRLKVRNPDGTETSELTYTRVDCPP